MIDLKNVETIVSRKKKNRLKKMRDLSKLKSIVEGKKKKWKKSNDGY
jgi:hypothetical protein